MAPPTAEGTPSTPPELMAAPGYLVRRMYQAYLALWTQTVDATLTGPQFAVLTAVRNHPGVDQGSLASVAALDRSTMADVARRLEDRGLIRRDTSPSDTRRKLLHLTDEGTRVLAETNDRARELDRLLLRGFPPEDRERLMADLTRLSRDWEHLSER
ncbi:MarR family transcriptional regulator [Halostreptopolyspora alba]|uniref:MarR family transcriptional regulator n=2 Tax=Halostreptopolyspora alba TaxID=2487137 RepID=A0A3N0EDH8_9ACTN|nr:MarR family transcriptional regulator [Nocardiopsaceae bacterium YIM 96095]